MIMSDMKLKKDILHLELKRSILSGKYKPGMRFPTEMELLKKYDISRITLRSALKQLVDDGLLLRVRPKGTFVNFPVEKKRLILTLFREKKDISDAQNYILPGIQQACKEKKYVFDQCSLDFIDSSFPVYRRQEIQGVIIFGGHFTGNEGYIQFLKKVRCPVVMAGCHVEDVRNIGFAGVRPDRKAAWLDGLRALKKNGHMRVATLSARRIQGFESDHKAYHETILKEKLSTPGLTFFSEYDPNEIKNALSEILHQGNLPTAILCYSDYYAMFLMRAANELGIQIPENLCIMGFSGYPGASFLNPPLATVDLQYFEMGMTAVELIHRSGEWFEKDSVAVPDVVIPHKVLMRKSAEIFRMEHAFVQAYS